jgi:hypothetical protein
LHSAYRKVEIPLTGGGRVRLPVMTDSRGAPDVGQTMRCGLPDGRRR